MHFWSKFGKPHFIWFWHIARTNSQAQNGVNLDFQVQFDLEDHRQSPQKTIGILIKVFYISDPNLVILAWTVDELSHGQAHDWRTHRHTHIHTHTHTHAGNDNTRRPKLASGNNFNILAGAWDKIKADCKTAISSICIKDMALVHPTLKIINGKEKNQYGTQSDFTSTSWSRRGLILIAGDLQSITENLRTITGMELLW